MQIKIDCPQCGGDIVFDEEIEVVSCQYCGSTNQITGKSGIPRFMFPPHWTDTQCHHELSTLLIGKESYRWEKKGLYLVYAPYWRTTGLVFNWLLGKRHTVSELGTSTWDDAKELNTKIFDFSFPAYREPDLNLVSLGIRTSAIPLQLFHETRLSGAEIVVSAEVSLQEAIKYSSSFQTYGFSDRGFSVDFEDTQLVGEVYSVVYFPFWVLEVGAKDRSGLVIIDGVANRVRKTVWDQTVESFFKKHPQTERAVNFSDLRLIPFTCPVCGWNLPFSPSSKTHICPTCTRAWSENAGAYREVDYQLVAAPKSFQHDICHMPFWALETKIQLSDGVLSTRSDLRKLLPNLPLIKEGENGSKSIQFLIPAFKIRCPSSLSKLANLFCVSPPSVELRPKKGLEKERFEAVCLGGAEAEQLARVVLISMVPRYNRHARHSLKESRLKVEKSRLLYYPFYRKGIYLREANSSHAIQRDTVAFSTQA
jgi:hypothetical protein